MAFWGIEVKPGKPYTHRFDGEQGRLHLSQATLGTGKSTKKSILQCNVGDKNPIYLGSFLPEKIETCQLNLEFEEDDEVIFSVIGPHSIHLSGFFLGETQGHVRDDFGSDSYGEDIDETESEESDESSDYDTEDELHDFIVDDMEMYPRSPVPNSGVVIEEILDDEKPANENGMSKRGKKKNRSSTSDDNAISERQIVVKSSPASPILESEDEDGFPISSPHETKADGVSSEGKSKENEDKRANVEPKKKKKTENDPGHVRSLKRKVDAIVQDGEQTRETGQQLNSSLEDSEVVPESDVKQKKKNKKKKIKANEEKTHEAGTGSGSNNQSEATITDTQQAPPVGMEGDQKLIAEKSLDINADSVAEGKKKKKKKKSKKQGCEADANVDQTVTDKNGLQSTKEIEEKAEGKPFQVRSFPNGLVIEELAMGKPDGNKASPGKKVCVHYIGKLQKNGKIFDSNIGSAPFKFRLGIGQVIKGWDVGVNGMRVGDKRRLTIPPAMGYGTQGAGKAIPPNSWLVFDVELVDVC